MSSASSWGGFSPSTAVTPSASSRSKANGSSKQCPAVPLTGERWRKSYAQVAAVAARDATIRAAGMRTIPSARTALRSNDGPSGAAPARNRVTLAGDAPAFRNSSATSASSTGGPGKANSSAVVPTSSGVRLCGPVRMASSKESTVRLSTTGTNGSPVAPAGNEATMSATGAGPAGMPAARTSRSASSSWSSVTAPKPDGPIPRACATRAVISAAASGRTSVSALDCAIAPWKSPAASGDDNRVSTLPPPADWPAIVTRSGSPPNAAMFSRTQRSAAIWSSTPRLPGAPAIQPKPSKPRR